MCSRYIACITKCSLYNVPGSPLVLIVKCGEGTLANLAGELVNFGGDRDTHRDPNKIVRLNALSFNEGVAYVKRP